MMDAFIALPYLIYSLGGGGQKQEQFKESVANGEGSLFRKTEVCKWMIVVLF